MKNKKMTYLLGLLVVIVWGLIFYRVFDAVSGDDDDVQPVVKLIKKEPYNDFAIAKDTTRLLLNYRDPFGLVKHKESVSLPVRRRLIKDIGTTSKKPPFDWSFIQYKGYIRNPVSKKMISLVSINGKNEMLSEGETRQQVRLVKNMRDSIKISYEGKTKCIIIKAAQL